MNNSNSYVHVNLFLSDCFSSSDVSMRLSSTILNHCLTFVEQAKHIQNHWHKRMVIGVIVLFAFGALGASIQEMFEPH